MSTIAGLLLASSAAAFTIETPVSEGCHERLTREAAALAGWPTAPPAGDATLVRDLPFTVLPETDAWTAALLVGVRDNDLHGANLFDPGGLPHVHLDDAQQREHCLRAADDDGENGDARALARCRAFILSEVALAVGNDDALDTSAKEPLRVGLRSQTATVPLSRFALHAGHALHALQDSYAHALRTKDASRVEHVLNYEEPQRSVAYDALRDGFPHQAELDRCPADDARVVAARAASAALLRALWWVNDGEGAREERLARAADVVDAVLSLDRSCGESNAWCGSVKALPDGSNVAAARDRNAVFFGALPRLPAVLLSNALTAVPTSTTATVIRNADTAVVLPRFGLGAAVGAALANGNVDVDVDVRFQPLDCFYAFGGVSLQPALANKSASGGVWAGGALSWLSLDELDLHTGVRAGMRAPVTHLASAAPFAAAVPWASISRSPTTSRSR
jgi:hypothetical protein